MNMFLDPEIQQKLDRLIKTGDENNIQLAIQLAKGYHISEKELLSPWKKLSNFIQNNFTLEGFDRNSPPIKSISNILALNELISYASSFGIGFDKLPTDFGHLSRLEYLDLRENNLASLPNSFGQLKKLQALDLGRNILYHVPACVFSCSKLMVLDLSINHITSMPDAIKQLTSLKELYLQANNLTVIPSHFQDLTQLEVLDLSHNKLTNLTQYLNKLSHLQSLNIQGNSLTLEIEQIDHLQNLKTLYVDKTQLHPNFVSDLPKFLPQLKLMFK